MKKLLATVAVASMFTACGGGGGDSVTNADPQGFWAGQASNGNTLSVVVLETDEAWGVYSSGQSIIGALYGRAAINGNSISIVGSDFNFISNTVSTGTAAGSITSKTSMNLTSSLGGTASLVYQSSYDRPPAPILGTWSFVGRSRYSQVAPGVITFDSNGRFVLNEPNCLTTGVATPRATGKNVYNLTMSASGSGCGGGQNSWSWSGVAYVDATTTPNKVLALALTPDKSDGLIVLGTRQ
jgi:hypothetical protein